MDFKLSRTKMARRLEPNQSSRPIKPRANSQNPTAGTPVCKSGLMYKYWAYSVTEKCEYQLLPYFFTYNDTQYGRKTTTSLYVYIIVNRWNAVLTYLHRLQSACSIVTFEFNYGVMSTIREVNHVATDGCPNRFPFFNWRIIAPSESRS